MISEKYFLSDNQKFNYIFTNLIVLVCLFFGFFYNRNFLQFLFYKLKKKSKFARFLCELGRIVPLMERPCRTIYQTIK